MLPSLKTLQDRLGRVNRRVWIAAALLLLVIGAFPFWGGLLGAGIASSMLAKRLRLEVAIDGDRGGSPAPPWRAILTEEPGRKPLAVIDQAVVPFAAAWQSGTVLLEA